MTEESLEQIRRRSKEIDRKVRIIDMHVEMVRNVMVYLVTKDVDDTWDDPLEEMRMILENLIHEFKRDGE